MILTIVGTHGQQFNRLVAAVDALQTDEPRIVQYGHSTVIPQHAIARDFIPFDEVERLITEARVVIAHAGTGTVMFALAQGKVPVVVPRLARFGEHVDDHQLELVESLNELGLIVACLPEDNLADKITEAASKTATRQIDPDPALVSYLTTLINNSAA